MVNIGKDAKPQILKESGRTTVAVIPVKVRARVVGRSVVTNAWTMVAIQVSVQSR